MKIAGDFQVAAPVEDVWGVFMDPEQLCRVMPGCEEAHQIDATHYDATLAAKVQFMTIRVRTTGELLESQEPSHLVAEMVGETLAMAGAFRARMTVDLRQEESQTHVHYELDVTMFGRLGSLGEPLVRSTANRLSTQFADNVSALFQEEGTPVES